MMRNCVFQFWTRKKKYFVVLAICIWGIIFITALMKNPSSDQTHTRLVMMKSDMDALIKNGGVVISSRENAKYGSALVYKTFSDEGWSADLLQKFNSTLIERKWDRVSGSQNKFCKEGVLAEIISSAGMHNGQGTNFVSMLFDATTIEGCRK